MDGWCDVTDQLRKYSDIEEHLAQVQTQLRQEKDRHAAAKAVIEALKKDKEEVTCQAKHAQLEEKKAKTE